MKTTIKIFSARERAAASADRDVGVCRPLEHAVADHPFAVGRLRRAAREAFCDKTLEVADPFGWRRASAIDCPRCRDLARRLFGSTVTRFRSGQSVWAEAQEGDRASRASQPSRPPEGRHGSM
jgi:hypothetical protein